MQSDRVSSMVFRIRGKMKPQTIVPPTSDFRRLSCPKTLLAILELQANEQIGQFVKR